MYTHLCWCECSFLADVCLCRNCADDWCRVGGNGGVSMRKRSVMKDILSEIRCDNWACSTFDLYREAFEKSNTEYTVEDKAIALYLYEHRHRYGDHIPTQARMSEFSLESMVADYAKPFFLHKIWPYQHPVRWVPLMANVKQYYPELWTNPTDNTPSTR